MKILLLALTVCVALNSIAQSDSLLSGVYHLDTMRNQRKQSIAGSTTDLSSLKVHTSTLAPGKTNHPPRALNNYEELIIIRNGRLKITINDSSKIAGPGSIALIIAGDTQSFQNVSDSSATYCVLSFQSAHPGNIKRGQEGGGSFVKDWNDLIAKQTDNGASRPVFDRPSSMFERFDVHATTLNPGFESHAPHTHRAEEIILLMQGNVTMHIGDKSYPAASGDMILLRPYILHNLKNTGSEPCWYYAIQWHGKAGE